MKRYLLVLGLALLLVSAWAGLAGAAELGLGGKIVYQTGNYAFTILETGETDDTTRYESSVSAPPLRFELGVTSGAWNLNGFLTTKSFGEAEVDPGLPDYTGGEDYTDCGGVTAFGGDLAYRFDVGSFKLAPSIGYRSMQIAVGQKGPYEGDVYASGSGFRTRGVRLGAEASASLSDRFSFSASLGCSPRLAVAEIYEAAIDIVDEGVHDRICIIYGLPKPDKAYSFDLAISAAARVIPAVEIVGGYRYEGIRVELDPSASQFDVSSYAVNASIFHIGAECRF